MTEVVTHFQVQKAKQKQLKRIYCKPQMQSHRCSEYTYKILEEVLSPQHGKTPTKLLKI